jgi:cytochrome c-type biogenesis protein CcmH/NrfG
MQVRNWFTLYFIPVFPMGGAQRFTQCSACGSQFRGNLDEMKSLMAQQAPELQSSYQAAIGLFNSLRETPGDSAKLAQLMQMYLQMGEFKEAVTAGRSFPAALEGSDACLAMMGQALVQSGDREGAARHVEAALALNPQNAQALALRNRALPQRTG